MSKNNYYAYCIESENNSGITESWKVCESVIKGKSARYKGFKTLQEAKDWLTSGAKYTYNPNPSSKVSKINNKVLEKGIYFDAGTGRGIGVEVRVTDEKGNNLLSEVAPKEFINEFGNYLAPKGSTNNYGELFGCYSAIKIALKHNIKHIFGDSKLVIDYWSRGHIKANLPESTIKLAQMVKVLRSEFEKNGGSITHVSGDINPADLGFHK
jgi:ribonuclease HI